MFTKKELKSLLALIYANRDSAKLQNMSNLSYLDSINMSNKINFLIEEIKQKEYIERVEGNFNISFNCSDKQYLIVDNKHSKIYKIPVNLVYNKKIAQYNIVNRKDEVESLKCMIAKTYPNSNHCDDREYDRLIIQKDLKILEDSYETFVIKPSFVKYGANGFITKKENIEDFNNACQELIDTYEKYLKEQETKR